MTVPEICEMCELRPGEPEHRCPYKEDMGGDDPGCNCCEECTYQCARDV